MTSRDALHATASPKLLRRQITMAQIGQQVIRRRRRRKAIVRNSVALVAWWMTALFGGLLFWALESRPEREAAEVAYSQRVALGLASAPPPPPGPVEQSGAAKAQQATDIRDECSDAANMASLNVYMWAMPRISACKQGEPALENLRWTFAGSTWFAFTLMTTIGYGSFVPTTEGGRWVVCVFGFFGIAVTGVVLDTFRTSFDMLVEDAVRRCCCTHRAMRAQALATVAIGFAWTNGIAIISAYRGEWSYFEGIYFAFTTLSTIGLGDFTFPDTTLAWVLLQFTLLLPGLVIFASVVRLASDAYRRAQEASVQVTTGVRRPKMVLPSTESQPKARVLPAVGKAETSEFVMTQPSQSRTLVVPFQNENPSPDGDGTPHDDVTCIDGARVERP